MMCRLPPPSTCQHSVADSMAPQPLTDPRTACVTSKIKGKQLVVARNFASSISPPLVLIVLILASISQRAPSGGMLGERRIWNFLASATCGFQVLFPTVKKLLQSR